MCIVGADKEARTLGELQTPLFYAARNDATKALPVLLKHECEYKEIRDYKGRTPLYVAAELGAWCEYVVYCNCFLKKIKCYQEYMRSCNEFCHLTVVITITSEDNFRKNENSKHLFCPASLVWGFSPGLLANK